MQHGLLTILLPLKGRHLHTLRFLWHLDRVRAPYSIVVADGQVHPTVARLLEDRATFPNLELDYVRYPDDDSFTKYYRKMADATDRLRTPYVIQMDNDDFIVPSGIGPSIEFLDEHADYVCSGGGIAGFELFAPTAAPFRRLTGPINRLTYRYAVHDRSSDLSDPSAVSRLYAGIRSTWPYYSVMRSPALKTIWREVREMDFSNLQILERFTIMRILTLGKARSDASLISCLRQYDTSMRSAYRKWTGSTICCAAGSPRTSKA